MTTPGEPNPGVFEINGTTLTVQDNGQTARVDVVGGCRRCEACCISMPFETRELAQRVAATLAHLFGTVAWHHHPD